jgi:hypothetical protein
MAQLNISLPPSKESPDFDGWMVQVAQYLRDYLGLYDSGSQVNFLQAGTGATTRTSQNKMRDVISVKDFGAIGNGTTDDTVSMQAAHDTGSMIYYPEGTYLFSKITATGGGIVGSGKSKTKLLTSSTNSDDIITFTLTGTITDGPEFRNFTIYDSTMKSGGSFIKIVGSGGSTQYVTVDNLYFYNGWDELTFQNVVYSSICNCQFINYKNTGFSISHSTPDAGDNTISGCLFNTAIATGVRTGIIQNSSGGLRIVNNKFLGGDAGYQLIFNGASNMSNVHIIGNSIENFLSVGLKFATTGSPIGIVGGIYIVGNEIAGSGDGIIANDSTGFLSGINIVGNHFYSATDNINHINLDHIDNFIIDANLFNAAAGKTLSAYSIGANATNGKIGTNQYRRIASLTNSSTSVVVNEDTVSGYVEVTTSTSYGSFFRGSSNVDFGCVFAANANVYLTALSSSGATPISVFCSFADADNATVEAVSMTDDAVIGVRWIAKGIVLQNT